MDTPRIQQVKLTHFSERGSMDTYMHVSYDSDLEITDESEDSDHYLDTEEIEDSNDEHIVGAMELSHSFDLQKQLRYLLVPKQNQKGREEGKVRNQVRLQQRRLKGKVKAMSARDQVLYLKRFRISS